jgi:hypothetical protein
VKTIIAGSRSVTKYSDVERAVNLSGFKITRVLSGKAPGADTLGESWALLNNVPWDDYPAAWHDLSAPGCEVKYHSVTGEPYNANAGRDRNQRMADNAEALIAVWDGKSPGTNDMITRAREKGLQVFVLNLSEGKK